MVGSAQLHQSLGGGKLDACARSRKCLGQGMGMAGAGEQCPIGDLAQSRGRGRRQLVLAIGNRLPQDLRKDGRPGRHGRGERAPVLGRKGVEANAVNCFFQRQADRGGAGIKVQGLQQQRLACKLEPEVSLGLAPPHRPRHRHLAVLVPDPDGDGVTRKLDLMAVKAPRGVREYLRRAMRLRHKRPARQTSDRGLGGFTNGGGKLDCGGGIGQERDSAGITNRSQGRGCVGREPWIGTVKNGQERRHGGAIEPAHVASQEGSFFRRDLRVPERFDQKGHGVRTGFLEPGDRVSLLFRRAGQPGHGLGDSLGLGRVPSHGRRQSFSQRLSVLAGRRLVRQSQDGTGAVLVTNLDQGRIVGLAFHERVKVRNSFLALPGPDQVIDCTPELHRGSRLLGKRLGPRGLGQGRGRRVQTGQRHGHEDENARNRNRAGTPALHSAPVRERLIATTEKGHGASPHGSSPIILRPGGHGKSPGFP